ncbi:peptidoglycan-associated lipoprotein Pal [Marinobacteraceae bacterium S3BR75-40.1]
MTMIDSAKYKALILAFSMAVVAGCSSTGGTQEGAAGSDVQPVDQAGGGEVYGAEGGGDVTSSEMEEQKTAAEKEMQQQQQAKLREVRTVYFDFDSAEIRAESRDVLMAHAQFLANNPSVNVVLQGHTDERGTKEYNLALGERRAKAVQRFLVVNGADNSQLETVSYGEERPAVMGNTEEAYAKNRRVEIIYQ